jgi:hypothetical protein
MRAKEFIIESRGGNYEQMNYRKSTKDRYVVVDRTLDAIILTTNNLKQAEKETIEWAMEDDIEVHIIDQTTGRYVWGLDGAGEAEEYISDLDETAAWHRKAGKNKNGGLNAKGVASYRREHPGSKLQTAVTTKPSKLKKGSKAAKRRKSFCARMGGVKGPMKKPNGKPTRKALSLRKWNCEDREITPETINPISGSGVTMPPLPVKKTVKKVPTSSPAATIDFEDPPQEKDPRDYTNDPNKLTYPRWVGPKIHRKIS